MFFNLKKMYFNQRDKWHYKNLRRLSTDGKILDVGCGKGDFATIAKKRVIAVDYNKLNLKHAKKQGIKFPICANALQLPFSDSTFENVHCADLIEHFSTTDALKLLKELFRVLKNNGALLISTPMPNQEFWGDPSHIRPYPPASIIGLFKPDREKGAGTNPTFPFVGHAILEGIYWRYRPLFRQPWRLHTNERRYILRNLLHPMSLAFFISNFLARFGVLKYWSPAGFSILLRKSK